MSRAGSKPEVGTHVRLDGETVEIVEFASLAAGVEVVIKDGRDRLSRISLRELLTADLRSSSPPRAGAIIRERAVGTSITS